MRWCLSTPGFAEYILPVTLSIAVTPVSPFTHCTSLNIYLEFGIMRGWRCTWRRWYCKLGGRNCVSLEIHLDAVIEWVWHCAWTPWSCEFGDALRGHDHANLEDVMVQVLRYSCSLWLSNFGDALGGHDPARLEEYFGAVNLEAVVQEGGCPGSNTQFIG